MKDFGTLARVGACVLIIAKASILPSQTMAQSVIPGAIISSQNLYSDKSFAAGQAITDIILNHYTAENHYAIYELIAQGVALVKNPGNVRGTFDIVLANSSPLCGSHGVGPYGPARVMTVTVDPGATVAVPISVIDFISGGVSSYAHLQIRHTTVALTVKTNSYLDVIMVPANGANNTPNEGPPFESNCP